MIALTRRTTGILFAALLITGVLSAPSQAADSGTLGVNVTGRYTAGHTSALTGAAVYAENLDTGIQIPLSVYGNPATSSYYQGLSIPFGRYRVRVEQPGFATVYWPHQYSRQGAGTLVFGPNTQCNPTDGVQCPTHLWTAEVPQLALLTGSVRHRSGATVPSAMVTASLSSETTFRPATSTTVNGEYSLRLPPGRYVVSTPNGNRSAQQTLQITGPAVQDLTLLDPPSAPPLVVAAIGNRQATVSWSQPVDDGGSPVTSFTVRATPGSSICTTQTRSCTVTGLENGRDHQFFVTADNAVGSSVSSLASNSVIPSASLPRPVANVRVVPADGAVDVIWSASPSDDVIEYTAVASPSGRSCSTATLTCSISGLRNGTAYTITVTARSQAGSSDAVSAGRMAIPTAVASAPRDVQVRPKPSALHVRWNPPRDDGGTKISEYVATAWPGGKTCTTRTTSCVIRALAPKTDYSITVRAMNSAGAGAISPGSAITRPMPGKPAPGRVAGLRVQIRKSAATVRWKASQRATSYLVRLTRPGRRSGTWLMVRRPQVQFSVERGTHIAQVRAVGTGGKGAMRQRTFRVQ